MPEPKIATGLAAGTKELVLQADVLDEIELGVESV